MTYKLYSNKVIYQQDRPQQGGGEGEARAQPATTTATGTGDQFGSGQCCFCK